MVSQRAKIRRFCFQSCQVLILAATIIFCARFMNSASIFAQSHEHNIWQALFINHILIDTS